MPYLLHTCAHGLHVGHYPPQPVPVLWPAPTLSPSFLLAQTIFKPNLFPYKYPNISQTSSFCTPTCLWRWNRQCVPKCQHTKFRRWEITQKKAYNMVYVTYRRNSKTIIICYHCNGRHLLLDSITRQLTLQQQYKQTVWNSAAIYTDFLASVNSVKYHSFKQLIFWRRFHSLACSTVLTGEKLLTFSSSMLPPSSGSSIQRTVLM